MSSKLRAAGIICALLCLSACAKTGQPAGSSHASGEPNPISPPEISIMSGVLRASPEELSGFGYDGDAPYYFAGEGGMWSEMGYSAAVFFCPNNFSTSKYADRERELVSGFALALDQFAVEHDFAEDMTADTGLPDGDYMSFGLYLTGERQHFLTVFESGDIYFTPNDGKGTPASHYRAKDPSRYAALKDAVLTVREGLDALPLDYQFNMSVGPREFLPESPALRIWCENIGARPVECSREFVVEKEENGAWRRLAETEPVADAAQMLTAPARGVLRYSLDLTNVEGGQQPGKYRVTNTFYADGQSLPFTAEYMVSTGATDISYPYSPEMTEENQACYDKYLSAWGFYSPFTADYTEQTFPKDFRAYLLYQSSVFQEGRANEYDALYGTDVPADIVENMVTRHFPVTAAQFRASLSGGEKRGEYYDAELGTYHFEGGYGGGSNHGVVTGQLKEGDLLRLTCDWYGVDDSFAYSHMVTIRLGEKTDEFYYMENKVISKADGYK